MKATILWIALAATSFAEPLIVVAPTTALEITEKQQSGSLSNLSQTVKSKAPVPRAASQSIIAQSEILHDGEHWTLVPKGAVLFVPQKKALYVGARPVGTLLQWRDFLAKNPAWISTHETSYAQASGDSPLPEETVEYWAKQDRVVVAVHQGGPISVAR